MFKEGLLEVREIDKGVSAVTALNLAHPLARAHAVPDTIKQQVKRQLYVHTTYQCLVNVS